MIRNGMLKEVGFFTGLEVENTKCKGQKTLFVVGKQDFNKVVQLAEANECTNIYFGANKSITTLSPEIMDLIYDSLIRTNFNITLDIPYSMLEHIPFYFKENSRFFVNVSIEIPNVESYNNLSFKIDDIDFNSTNPGVWVFSINELPKETYNAWSVYEGDNVL